MSLKKDIIQNPLSTIRSGGFSHEHKALLMTLFIFFLIFGTGAFVWAYGYKERIAPKTIIGSVMVGGMNKESASQLIQQTVDDLISTGVSIVVDGKNVNLPLSKVVTTDVIEDVTFDVEGAINQAFTHNRSQNPFIDTGFLLYQLVFPIQIPIKAGITKENIRQSVYELFPEKETLSTDASFVFTKTDIGLDVKAVAGSFGREFDFDSFFPALNQELENLQSKTIQLLLVEKDPLVSLEEAEAQTEMALQIVLNSPITFSYENQYGKIQTWVMEQVIFAEALIPTKIKEVSLDEDKINSFLDTIANQIEIKKRDAKIEINNGRVTQFVESRNGIVLDRSAVYNSLLERLKNYENKDSIELVTIIEKPLVEIGDINDLGITEVLGFGTSSYKGSPWNRKQNIQNGVNLLNGILIPPGESFSLIDALKPFTIENGYLPELVIKGDQIKPEIGGGLCQIGTTTFRAVMNSGLKITKRQNHSLVVSYYNDPSNGNPGTDATIYDPAPNFEFINDTKHYILFQAENLTATQELKFTFWGTNDGRKGSYEPPTVLRWIPVGEEKKIETTNLEPGKQSCQAAHIGADTTFDYTVVKANGETEVVTYESHYRPLPKICLIGVHKKTAEVADELGPDLNQILEIIE